MKRAVWYVFFWIVSLILYVDAAPYSIVFVHIGQRVPLHVKYALEQARLFNPIEDIFLILNKVAKIDDDIQQVFSKNDIKLVYCEDLPRSAMHKKFLSESTLNTTFLGGFWFKTTERFFYLDELITQYNLQHVFHLENDNMLYLDLSEHLEIFKQYKKIAAVFDNDDRCIPSFMYFSNKNAINHLVKFIAERAKKGLDDMKVLALYKNEGRSQYIEPLPIIMAEYAQTYPLITPTGKSAKDKMFYSYHIDRFNSIFDAAALGQYLGGIDPKVGQSKPGFINESCVFNPSRLKFTWEKDEQGRKIPYAIFQGKYFRINNLHIHSKKLENFKS